MQTQIPISIQFDLGQFVAFFSQLPPAHRTQIFEALKPYLTVNPDFEFKNEEQKKVIDEQKIHAIEKFKGGLANYSGYETTKQGWYEQ